jgi:predicted transcriptional regulator
VSQESEHAPVLKKNMRIRAIQFDMPFDPGYTFGMKTAVSIPDEVFRAVERHAKRARKSRSELYADALSEYIVRHAPDEVTEAMNRVIDQVEAGSDPFVARAARRILERSEW